MSDAASGSPGGGSPASGDPAGHGAQASLLRTLLILTLVAGSVDAVSYLGLGRVFTANMTGNLVLLGLAIGQGQALEALRSVVAFVGFAAGAGVGGWVVGGGQGGEHWPSRVTLVLGVEL